MSATGTLEEEDQKVATQNRRQGSGGSAQKEDFVIRSLNDIDDPQLKSLLKETIKAGYAKIAE